MLPLNKNTTFGIADRIHKALRQSWKSFSSHINHGLHSVKMEI